MVLWLLGWRGSLAWWNNPEAAFCTVLEWGVGEVGERKGRGQGGVLQTEK